MTGSQMTDIRLFDGISAGDRESMLGCLGYSICSFDKGEIISPEQEEVKNIGIILEGAVHMLKEDIWGGKTIIAYMKKGELFGESFACGSDRRSTVTFYSPESSVIMFIPFDKMLHSCCRSCAFHQRLIENLMFILADKTRQLMEKAEIISRKTLREKIMTYLSAEAQRQGTLYFEIPLGRSELADFLCADRSALTRELGKLKNDGMIDFDRNTFRINRSK